MTAVEDNTVLLTILNSTHYLIRKPSIDTEQADGGLERGGWRAAPWGTQAANLGDENICNWMKEVTS